MAWMTPQCCVPGTLAASVSRNLPTDRNFLLATGPHQEGMLGQPNSREHPVG